MIGSLKRHLTAIFGGDRRRNKPVDKIRNFEKKKLLVKKLIHCFCGCGRNYVFWVHGELNRFGVGQSISPIVKSVNRTCNGLIRGFKCAVQVFTVQ